MILAAASHLHVVAVGSLPRAHDSRGSQPLNGSHLFPQGRRLLMTSARSLGYAQEASLIRGGARSNLQGSLSQGQVVGVVYVLLIPLTLLFFVHHTICILRNEDR
jgi:hypothetical protein